ncbi:MAG: hypothetical protein RLN62_05375 [Rickettsiales bacterium]
MKDYFNYFDKNEAERFLERSASHSPLNAQKYFGPSSLFKFVTFVQDFLKSNYNVEAELSKEPSEWSASTVAYVWATNLNAGYKGYKFIATDIELNEPMDFVFPLKKAKTFQKTFSDKQMHMKLFQWVSYVSDQVTEASKELIDSWLKAPENEPEKVITPYVLEACDSQTTTCLNSTISSGGSIVYSPPIVGESLISGIDQPL